MPSWIVTALPFVAPVALAIVTTMITSSLLTPRRLRREVTEDIAIAQGTRGVARGLIAADIRNRTIALTAWNRYPAIIPQDLIRMAVLIILAALLSFQAWSYVDTPPETFYLDQDLIPPLIVVTFSVGQYYALLQSLYWRTVDRQRLLVSHAVPIPGDRLFSQIVSQMTASMLGVLATVVPPAACLLTLANELDANGWIAAIALVASIGAAGVMLLVQHAMHNRPPTMEERLERANEAERRTQGQTKFARWREERRVNRERKRAETATAPEEQQAVTQP